MSNKLSTVSFRFVPEFSAGAMHFEADIPAKGLTCIYGASGAGKTTLLRCIAGLEKVSNGELVVMGDQWQSSTQVLPTHERPIGFVFQESRLFEHLTVADNLSYGQRRKTNGISADDAAELVDVLNIGSLMSRFPRDLSGGEKQRVAIARALFSGPKLLLMDEPLASIDENLKQDVLAYLEKVRDQIKIPIIYVSHQLTEIVRLADYMLVVEKGRCVQGGSTLEVLNSTTFEKYQKSEPFSLVEGEVQSAEDPSLVSIVCDSLTLLTPLTGSLRSERVRVQVFSRDVSLSLEQAKESSILNILPATITDIRGGRHEGQKLIDINVEGKALSALVTDYSRRKLGLKVGQQLYAQIKAVSLVR